MNDTWLFDGTTWTQSIGAAPGPSSTGGMAYDASRGVTVLFGGANSHDAATAETWEFDGSAWAQRVPTVSPPAAIGSVAAYDSAIARVVTFGGVAGSEIVDPQSNETWIYNGSFWQHLFDPSAPSARSNVLSTYDSARDRIVMFGGFDASGLESDTWEFTGSNWLAIRVFNGPSLEGNYSPAMVFDSFRNKTVLFGTLDSGDAQTWEYDGSAWTHVTTAGTTGGSRANPTMVYDSDRHRIVMFGGTLLSGADPIVNDTWEYDGSTWTQIVTANSPPPRIHSAISYDPVRHRVVLFGGSSTTQLQDTWEYDGTNWVQVFPTQSPPVRDNATMTYDVARSTTVLFGGSVGSLLNDTWEYDGTTWTQLAPTEVPTARLGNGMLYDGKRDRVLILNGNDSNNAFDDDMWALRFGP